MRAAELEMGKEPSRKQKFIGGRHHFFSSGLSWFHAWVDAGAELGDLTVTGQLQRLFAFRQLLAISPTEGEPFFENSGQINQDQFLNILKTCFNDENVTIGPQSKLRRVVFKAHHFYSAIQRVGEMGGSSDHTESARMPAQECDRTAREAQGGSYSRIAYCVVDKFTKMACLHFVPLHTCVSHEDEMGSIKSAKQLLTLEKISPFSNPRE